MLSCLPNLISFIFLSFNVLNEKASYVNEALNRKGLFN